MADVLNAWGGKQFGEFKPALADLAVEMVGPIAGRMRDFLADPAEIDRILGDGARRANAIAQPIVEKTYDIVGLLRSR